MNIHIFQTKSNETTEIFRNALEKRGHKVTTRSCEFFELTNPNNFDLKNVDIVYYWGGIGSCGKMCVLDFLNTKKIPFVNRGVLSDCFLLNKIGQAYTVARAGINTPKTFIKKNLTYEEMTEALGIPFIMKAAIGSCGTQVFLIKNQEDFNLAKDSLKNEEVLYQEHIPNDGDFRVHVIGGCAVCAYKRTPAKDNFKANVAQGGAMEKVENHELLSRLYDLSEKVAKSFNGADIVGVDLIQDKNTGKLYFIEINYIPGIKQVKEVTGIDVAEHMADYFESIVTN